MAFRFTGFNGKNFVLHNLPSIISEYSYYLMYEYNNNIFLFCFNDGFSAEVNVENRIIFSYLDGTSFRCFFTTTNAGSWQDRGDMEQFTLLPSYIPVYSSENLLNYKELIMTNNFSFPVPEVSTNSLSLILVNVDQKENIAYSVFNEIFDILPVLLVVLISFIGIRKGITWLFSFLKHS